MRVVVPDGRYSYVFLRVYLYVPKPAASIPRCRGPPGPYPTSQDVFTMIDPGVTRLSDISGRLSLWTWLPRYREAGIPACQPASSMLCRREDAISILCLFSSRQKHPSRSFILQPRTKRPRGRGGAATLRLRPRGVLVVQAITRSPLCLSHVSD